MLTSEAEQLDQQNMLYTFFWSEYTTHGSALLYNHM
jgi:hypothetical protein